MCTQKDADLNPEKGDNSMDATVTSTSFADFIKANYEKIKAITPLNPTLSKDDEWRTNDSWDKIFKESDGK